ncbi:MAG: CoA-binding protein [Gallionellales bacterium RIFCSPLOWO2_12_FULL_59_22]|nr:MAG: CoA-binding protein [Gallionellales bacterium RIFCSPLOWO2_02_FULL_59_110]OGT09936.1 MAG: CoA-binding protein [Gallionellales bacterium RIFCSPLOWO2_12_FULL_59_22]
MRKPGIKDFKYFVGIRSLAEIATKEDRICVLNITGNESRAVTPVSHAYSGGNVVFGTSPGRRGQVVETPAGNIPVYNNVREGMEAGHKFNVGVVYLPPSAVRDGVAELIRINPDVEKVIILTEKVAVHDAREIRALGQQRGVDIFGANCLGVADSWNHVRIGGALGGDKPEETLRKGTVAIYSNSGNFTTTIANYLSIGGWGTTTLISSGKDIYINYAVPEFAFAMANDERTKAAVLYSEPGGYYEQDVTFGKPVVACVVGRWKANLTRAVGHAGAIAGSGDDARAKEKWFMDKFGVSDLFTPENPVCSKKGAVVTNISHIPLALTAVMKLNGVERDFPPEGNLELKPWFGDDQGLKLPPELNIPVVKAMSPYDEQIAELFKNVGAIFPRQSMKDCSGSSVMDPKTQVTKVNNISILDTAKQPLESNLCMALVRELNDANDNALFNLAVAAHVNLHGDAALAAAEAARDAGNAPNTAISAAVALLGPKRADGARNAAETLAVLFAQSGLLTGDDEQAKIAPATATSEQLATLLGSAPDAKAEAMLKAFDKRGAKSAFVKYLRSLKGHPTADAVLAALTTTVAWEPLIRKRISKLTVRNLPWYAKLFGLVIGASTEAKHHAAGSFCGVDNQEILDSWTVTQLAYISLLGERPTEASLFPLQVMLGLIISNGVGTISAQGCKGAVSADGPESPERVQINKGMIGFMTHTGFAHGGNGYEGIQFLIESFKGTSLTDASVANHGLDLKAMATEFALAFNKEKKTNKALGVPVRSIPGVNHPVFKGHPVNHDPREVYIADLFAERGEKNVFHDYYRTLVQALYDNGVTANVFCVNIDAIIAAMLLKLLWLRYRKGEFSESSMEMAAFTAFLFGRMAGCAGEIDDHINRGRNMDTRTPASQCSYVS